MKIASLSCSACSVRIWFSAVLVAAVAAWAGATTSAFAADSVYVNGTWAGLTEGTQVPVEGGTATIGVDAFATGDEAVACYGGTQGNGRTLVFLGGGTLSSFAGFEHLKVQADSMVEIARIGVRLREGAFPF